MQEISCEAARTDVERALSSLDLNSINNEIAIYETGEDCMRKVFERLKLGIEYCT